MQAEQTSEPVADSGVSVRHLPELDSERVQAVARILLDWLESMAMEKPNEQ